MGTETYWITNHNWDFEDGVLIRLDTDQYLTLSDHLTEQFGPPSIHVSDHEALESCAWGTWEHGVNLAQACMGSCCRGPWD